jgi:transposase
MLSLPAAVRIFLCTQAVDMRQGFDRLAGLAESVFAQDPLSGHLFLFLNRRRDRLKILFWDRDGLAMFYKRLEGGTFQLPAHGDQTHGVELEPTELAMLLGGIDLATAQRRKRYRRAS